MPVSLNDFIIQKARQLPVIVAVDSATVYPVLAESTIETFFVAIFLLCFLTYCY